MFVTRRALNLRAFSRCFSSEVKPPTIKGTYYEILDVPKDAKKEVLTQKYKELGILTTKIPSIFPNSS